RARRASSSNFRIFAMAAGALSEIWVKSLRPCARLLVGVLGPGARCRAKNACYEAGWPGRRPGVPLLLDDREDVAGREDEVLLAVVLDLGAAVLAVQNDVADLHVELDALAVLDAARTDGQDDALLGLLLGGVRNDQARSRGLLGVERLDHDAVLERLDGNLGAGGRHDPTSPFGDLTGLTV